MQFWRNKILKNLLIDKIKEMYSTELKSNRQKSNLHSKNNFMVKWFAELLQEQPHLSRKNFKKFAEKKISKKKNFKTIKKILIYVTANIKSSLL